jgi:hypothetical protein
LDKEPKEPVLPDDYPVFPDYYYLFDGRPGRSFYPAITVKQLKRYSGAREIRRCDAVARGLGALYPPHTPHCGADDEHESDVDN